MTTSSRPSYTDILDQDQQWWPASGQPIQLDDMGPRHRRNTLALIRRQASQHLLQIAIQAMDGGASDGVMDALTGADPEQWIEDEPLVIRLRELVAADQANGVPDEPDERIGKPLPCAHWCLICAEHGPITEPGTPLPCASCPDCDIRVAAADDATWD